MARERDSQLVGERAVEDQDVQCRLDDRSPPEHSMNQVCYHQNCPVCGRNLRIRVMLLGRRVYCQHCGGGFIASDGGAGPARPVDRPQAAIVDELLERAALMLARSGE